MKKRHKNNNIYGFKLIEVIVIVIITGILCTVATGIIFHKHYENSLVGAYEKVGDNEYVNEFLQIYASIINEYYENVNQSELIDSAINGMFSYLGDDYSEHLTQDQTNDLLETLSGEYEGIGVEIYLDKVINSVFDNSPAQKAGLQVGDKIIRVAGEDVSGKDNSYVADKIKSSKGKIEIVVIRNEQEISVTVEKDNLDIPSVTSKIVETGQQKVGYLQISSFSNTTYNQFEAYLKKLEAEGISGLVIDVRNNSGGYLKSAKDIASLFLKKGKVIYSLSEKGKTTKYKDQTSTKRNYKVAVLINEYSASASEILAAALKDSYGATLVGKKSYGKGKVQQTMTLEDGSLAKYTTARWLTPSGICIDKIGLSPDYIVDIEINETQDGIIDKQYDKAIEVVAE